MINNIEQFVVHWGLEAGLDELSAKVLTCLFLSFPLAAVFKRLPDSYVRLKQWYIIR
ncbi:unnamed protein product [Kuraishia capsulata CBS 1993]|uniref:Uncharacterized protein n=1 Tax=Kuraishia capsulata CBS 1993 TaxID=1382522 RepID=W6MJ84_9ASCO|nr:uncharacterized protein KUCA_T00002541001 [Kuraishia capsulata CBS 1993]CDK26569.1 unnamed protein product [Kuraishia capsulata CBS 1993]